MKEKGANYWILAEDPKEFEGANQFLESLKTRGLSPRTIRAYSYDILSIYNWLRDCNLGKSIVDLFQADLIEFIKWQNSKEANPKSINRRLITCRLLFEFLTGGAIPGNRGITLPSGFYKGRGRDKGLGISMLPRQGKLNLRVKTAQKIIEPLTPDQVRIFLGSLSRYRDVAIVYSMLLCGLRSHEVISLKTTDISSNERTIKVMGKGQKERLLPSPKLLIGAVEKYTAWERPDGIESNHLFVVLQGPRKGQPMTTAGLRSLFRHRRKKVNLDLANAHRFRHTFGADMARSGVRLPILQRLMGHADSHTTLQYITLSMDDVVAEYDRAMRQIENRYLGKIF